MSEPIFGPPLGMLAELTHRCPLRCPYCSNPVELDRRSRELDTQTWRRVFSQASDLGVLQVHLSGGEPALRGDIVELTAHCAAVGLYTNLITSGVMPRAGLLAELSETGLDHVQLSIQAARAGVADGIGGHPGGHDKKLAFAREVVELGLPLTLNATVHRQNLDQLTETIELAGMMDAKRLEIAHVQYYGWALANRAALMPTEAQIERATAEVEAARARLRGQLVIDYVLPDYYARYPKPCMGGWGQKTLNVTPSGRVLPCHAAETIPGLEFWNVQNRSLAEIWADSPAFNAFRGTGWMQEPCRSCPRAEVDFGGCRCQALAIAGNARAADPACHLSPAHGRMRAAAVAESADGGEDFAYRGFRRPKPRERVPVQASGPSLGSPNR